MTVDETLVERIAALTYADPRSVRRVLQGGHVRGRAGERIRVALAALREREHAGEPSARELAEERELMTQPMFMKERD